MTKNNSNSGSSRRREILEEADWRQRAAPPPPNQEAEFNANSFPNAPWQTPITCDNPERLPCPPGPWSNGADTISRQEFCCYLHSNGYDDVKEVIDIAERQFAAHFRAPVEARSLGRLRPAPVPAVPEYDAPQEVPSRQGDTCLHPAVSVWRPVSPISRPRPSVQGGGPSAPAGSDQNPYQASQQRSSGIISPGISHLPATTHSPDNGLSPRRTVTNNQPWRAVELVSTVHTFPPKPPATTEQPRTMPPPGPVTPPSPSEQSSVPEEHISADLQYTIDDFKSYIARQMATEIIHAQEDEETRRDDRLVTGANHCSFWIYNYFLTISP
ncbi:hypothetical protein DL98DRAFT_524282 [Cadophora sp. DSE1049]|nr:hypothetical protein DL98DRAFT_524282 [Cadophora sp. DSE1049]